MRIYVDGREIMIPDGTWPRAEALLARHLRDTIWRPIADDAIGHRIADALVARIRRTRGGENRPYISFRYTPAQRAASRERGHETARKIAIVRAAWSRSPRQTVRALIAAAAESAPTLEQQARLAQAWLIHARGRKGVVEVRARLDRIIRHESPRARAGVIALRLNPFVVMESSAPMPRSCWGHYRNVAVIETDGRGRPAIITESSRHFRRIVRFWPRVHDGGDRSAAARARRDASALAAHLNLLHRARMGRDRITIEAIDGAENEEFRRELIDAMGGLEAYRKAWMVPADKADQARQLVAAAPPQSESGLIGVV